jgi:urease accessory protein
MLRAQHVEHAGHWPAQSARGAVTLNYDERHRRRARLTTDRGEDVLLDLPRALLLAEGDGLALDDGGWIAVRAAVEPLLEVRVGPDLPCRLAWHIGNRHLPAQIEPSRILIRPDHVIATMLARLGASLREVEEAFRPEAGAYAHQHD